MKYLSQHRIRRARALLANTDRPIAEISLETGHCDQSYFGGVFRKLVGLTPAAYRHRYQDMRLSDLNGIRTNNNGNPLYVSQCSGQKGILHLGMRVSMRESFGREGSTSKEEC
jgi:hypothetical protein